MDRPQTAVQLREQRALNLAKAERDMVLTQAEADVAQALFDYAQLGKASAADVAKAIAALIQAIIDDRKRR